MLSMSRSFLSLLLAVTMLAAMTASAQGSDRDRGRDRAEQLVIGHRGASGYRPEHTLAAYELAARHGADYIEPDLVITKDGVLVARHEPEISGTTDVADAPGVRRPRPQTKIIDGAPYDRLVRGGLHARRAQDAAREGADPVQRPSNAAAYDGQFEIPTLQEVHRPPQPAVEAARPRDRHLPRDEAPDVLPRTVGLPLEEPLVRILHRNGLDHRRAPVFVQSFEVGNLKLLDRELDVPLVQLLSVKTARPYDLVVSGDPRTYAELATPGGSP